MKTMKQLNEVIRVKDDDVMDKLDKGWFFCKKSEFKALHGNKPKEVAVEVKTEVVEDAPKVKGKAGGKHQSKYRTKQANN